MIPAILHDDRADWHFAGLERLLRHAKRLLHKGGVGFSIEHR
jgi:hypothetical protein